MIKPTLIIFAKPPRMGLSKTRLARDIGYSQAQRINRAITNKVLRSVSDERWQTRLCVAPDLSVSWSVPEWRNLSAIMPQGGGDLGQRLRRALMKAPKGPVMFIGTDAPDVSGKKIAQAIKLLRTHDAVFGPADDGGFWLFGLNNQQRRSSPFENVRWSSEHALSDVRQNMGAARVGYLETLIDLDDGHALQAWRTSVHARL